ncbi:hypothetical protein SCHAM137S_02155 [Streptomyces chartreusis]
MPAPGRPRGGDAQRPAGVDTRHRVRPTLARAPVRPGRMRRSHPDGLAPALTRHRPSSTKSHGSLLHAEKLDRALDDAEPLNATTARSLPARPGSGPSASPAEPATTPEHPRPAISRSEVQQLRGGTAPGSGRHPTPDRPARARGLPVPSHWARGVPRPGLHGGSRRTGHAQAPLRGHCLQELKASTSPGHLYAGSSPRPAPLAAGTPTGVLAPQTIHTRSPARRWGFATFRRTSLGRRRPSTSLPAVRAAVSTTSGAPIETRLRPAPGRGCTGAAAGCTPPRCARRTPRVGAVARGDR